MGIKSAKDPVGIADIQGVVATPTLVEGTTALLTLTNDGSLRVVTVEARFAVRFHAVQEEEMWNSLEATWGFTGSPWTEW